LDCHLQVNESSRKKRMKKAMNGSFEWRVRNQNKKKALVAKSLGVRKPKVLSRLKESERKQSDSRSRCQIPALAVEQTRPTNDEPERKRRVRKELKTIGNFQLLFACLFSNSS
jgi:hypothetical protein